MVLQSLAESDQTNDANDPGRIHTPESVLRLVFTTVFLDVASTEPVIEPVTPEFRENCADHGCEVEQGAGRVTEAVALWCWWLGEEGDSVDHADCPHCDPWCMN